MFHRPLAYYVNLFLRAGFVLDEWAEPAFRNAEGADNRFEWHELPPAIIFRFRNKP
mgnify:CR=1 FL=1